MKNLTNGNWAVRNLAIAVLVAMVGLTSSQAFAASRYLLTYSMYFPAGKSTCTYTVGVRMVGKKVLVNNEGSRCRFASGRTGGSDTDRANGTIYRLNASYSEKVKCTWKSGGTHMVCSNGQRTKMGVNTGSTNSYVTNHTYTSKVAGRVLTLTEKQVMGGAASTKQLRFNLDNCSGFSASYRDKHGTRAKPISCKIAN